MRSAILTMRLGHLPISYLRHSRFSLDMDIPMAPAASIMGRCEYARICSTDTGSLLIHLGCRRPNPGVLVGAETAG